MKDIYSMLATEIIKQQEDIVGPLAWIEAQRVSGLDVKDQTVNIKKDGKKVLQALVNQYETLFGQASVEVCRDAVRDYISEIDRNKLPSVLVS